VLWRSTILFVLSAAIAFAQNDTAQQSLQHAIELQQSGQYAQAIDAYKAFLKVHPEAAPVRSNLGAALAHEGRFTEAIQQYNLALKADPSNFGIRLNLGLALYKAGDIPKAVRQFETVYATQPTSDPNHDRVALLLAECYLRQGNNQHVVALLGPLEASHPDDHALEYMLGTALLHLDQTDRGAQLIQRLFANGNTAEAHMLLAYTWYQAHDKKKALAEVNQAIALNPNLPEAYSLKGRLEYLESNLEDAEAAFRKSLELDGNNFDALQWRGTLLREEGRLPESEKCLTHALQLQPGEMRARYQYARLVSDEGDDKRAAQLLEALVKDHPEYTEAHRTLATIYFRLKRPDDGRRERQIAAQMDAAIQKRDQEQGRSMTK
jgi:tetratricopeptide (TPR) repeat protein